MLSLASEWRRGAKSVPSNGEPDWCRLDDYRALQALDRPGFAWEFLRRNRAFRAASARTPLPREDRIGDRLVFLDAPAGGAAHWGLWFPRLRRPRCRARPLLVAGGRRSGRDHRRCDSRSAGRVRHARHLQVRRRDPRAGHACRPR
ncbi:transcriptional regulator domain-containing protein [Sphingomonas agrestis]|uniref:transcriptional regulator domain-containing protein n=1 Tax=Sphingomonas agrestis TaxID=3080540 RepID=UPI00374DD685